MATATRTRRPKPARVPRWQKKAIREKELERRAAKRDKRKSRRASRRKVYSGAAGAVWVGKRPLGVLYLAGLTYLAGFAATRWPRNTAGVAALVAVAAVLIVWRVGYVKVGADKAADRWSPFRHRFWIGVLAADAGWLVAATHYGTAAPMPGILFSVALAASLAWWVHLYWPEPEQPAKEEVEIDHRLVTWDEGVKPLLPPKTRFHSLEDVKQDDDGDGDPDMLGFAGTVQLPLGIKATWPAVADVQANIAAAYDVPFECVEIEPTVDRNPSRCRVMVLDRRNPTHEVNYYDRSWQVLKDGCYPIGTFPDGARSWQRLYLPGSGPVHSLFSGDSGSGKSRGMSASILQSTMTGLCVPFVADPQGGQSMPAWAGRAGKAVWIADNPDEIAIMVHALIRLMRSRSARIARREWEDEDGITRVGMDYHDPAVMPDLPIIDWWLDEAADVLSDRALAEQIEKAARMFRKTGCRMNLGTQYPAIEDLGNRMGLRNQVTTGNVVSYKLGTGVGKTMVLPGWAPNPADIPEIGQNGEHTKGMNFTKTSAPGGDRRTFQRTVRVANEHKWAEVAATRVPQIEKESQDAMGDDWYKRWERREQAEHAPVVIDLAPAVPGTPPAAPASTRDAILAFLTDHDGPAHSGAISTAIDMGRPATSNALSRLKDDGKVSSPRRGMWQLADDRELVSA